MLTALDLPPIIQGGMGAAVSSWRLASAVSRTGQLGVVSGVALDLVLARRLQDGDPEGHLRRALAHFPNQEMVERVLTRYFIDGGRATGTPYAPVPRLTVAPQRSTTELVVLGGFAEVWLAKEGHDGQVLAVDIDEGRLEAARALGATDTALVGRQIIFLGDVTTALTCLLFVKR